MVTRVSWRDRSFSCGGGGPQLPRRIVVRVVAVKVGTDRLYKCRLIAVQLQHLIYFLRDDRLCRSLLTGLRGDSLPSPETCGKPPSPHDGRALDPKLTPNSQLRHAIALVVAETPFWMVSVSGWTLMVFFGALKSQPFSPVSTANAC
jgi:hypothetical protein